MEDFSTPIEKFGRTKVEQSINLTAAYTAVSQTALQKLFNSITNGAFNCRANTSYHFEGEFDLSSMSATSGTFSFGFLGTAVVSSIKYFVTSSKPTAAINIPSAAFTSIVSSAASTVISSASTGVVGFARVSGIIRITTAGTLIPAFGLSVASAAVVGSNSRFCIWQVGSNTMTNTGNWT